MSCDMGIHPDKFDTIRFWSTQFPSFSVEVSAEQGRIYREANDAYASGPLTYRSPSQDRGRVPSNVLGMPWYITVHIWKKFYRRFPKNPKISHDIYNNEAWNWKKLF